ncbi:MAG: hypothetical protein EBZ13_10515 [Planctomycetia bacterium]|nr:hypothetical protein [Planctomycetia bacterium]
MVGQHPFNQLGQQDEEAATIAGRVGLEIEIWDQPRLEREGCRAMLAVAKGSSRSPRLVVLRYRGPGQQSDRPDLALVGKGVTFDSGGGQIDPVCNQGTPGDDLDRRPEPDRCGKRMLFLLCPIDVLPHHAHRCTGDGLFELIVGPAALGQKSNAASRPARQLPGGHGSSPVEQASIGFSSRAGPDHE